MLKEEIVDNGKARVKITTLLSTCKFYKSNGNGLNGSRYR
jgi:hypothetical protein